MVNSPIKVFGLGLCLLLVSITISATTKDNRTCGIIPGQQLTNGYGPYDFTNPKHAGKLAIVLGAHFTPEVERLIRGSTSTSPHGDIDYTLRAIPNYHRALYAASKLEQRERNTLNNGERHVALEYSAECYFKRAIYFQPNDAIAHMLYAMHLNNIERQKDAEKHYLIAIALQPNNTELNYNLGLFYADLGDIENAKKHAKVAYDADFPLDGLKNKIARLNQKNN